LPVQYAYADRVLAGRCRVRLPVLPENGKGAGMVPQRLRLWMAGLVAFLVGVPLAKEAYAQSLGDFVGFVIDASIYASDGDS